MNDFSLTLKEDWMDDEVMAAARQAADEWNACDPPTSIPPDAVKAIVQAALGAPVPEGHKRVVAVVDPEAWSGLLEAWGDGSNDWDRSDVEPVYKGAIHPIAKALDPSYDDSPPYGDKWLEDEEEEDG